MCCGSLHPTVHVTDEDIKQYSSQYGPRGHHSSQSGSGIYNRCKVITDNKNILGFGDPQIINDPLLFLSMIYIEVHLKISVAGIF